jgi:hypothetical protein
MSCRSRLQTHSRTRGRRLVSHRERGCARLFAWCRSRYCLVDVGCPRSRRDITCANDSDNNMHAVLEGVICLTCCFCCVLMCSLFRSVCRSARALACPGTECCTRLTTSDVQPCVSTAACDAWSPRITRSLSLQRSLDGGGYFCELLDRLLGLMLFQCLTSAETAVDGLAVAFLQAAAAQGRRSGVLGPNHQGLFTHCVPLVSFCG